MKVLIISDLSKHALANSYIRAFKSKGVELRTFDLQATEKKYIQFAKVGKKIHTFWPVEAWIRKANRELAVEYRKFIPDLVIVFGSAPILFGTLAFFKSIGTTKVVLYWPDTLLNLKSYHKDAASLYNLVATYSNATINPFKAIGFNQALFLPFAGDEEFLGTGEINNFSYDVSFAGGWRPEREAALSAIIAAFPNLKLLIKGTDWERFCKNDHLRKCCDPKPVYGNSFGDFIRKSRINLNVIDETNFPAANMRFFEVPMAGGLQLSSTCPEMERIFLNKTDILYYKDQDEMLEQVNWVLTNPDAANQIRKSGYEKVKREHTYKNRIEDLIKFIN